MRDAIQDHSRRANRVRKLLGSGVGRDVQPGVTDRQRSFSEARRPAPINRSAHERFLCRPELDHLDLMLTANALNELFPPIERPVLVSRP